MASIRRHKKGSKAKQERKICVACIVSDVVLSRVCKVYDPQLVESKYVNDIIDWCVGYYNKYSKAPREVIQDIFERRIRKTDDEDKIEVLSSILSLCSKEFERAQEDFNDQYYLDCVLEYFTEQALENLSDDIKDLISKGDVQAADQTVVDYKRIQVECDTSFNPFTDIEKIQKAFEASDIPLVRFRGAYGEMVRDDNFRESLVAFLAPEKRGKTWMLQEYAFAAMRARKNTCFFSVGDMGENEMIIRNGIRLSGRSNKKRYCGEMLIPVLDCENNQTGICSRKTRKGKGELGIEPEDVRSNDFEFEEANSDYRPCSNMCAACKPSFWYEKREPVEPLTWREAYKEGVKFFKRMKGREYKVECFPNSSCCVKDIDDRLAAWEEMEQFIPDVIIIDYADILAPEPQDRNKDTRTQINGNWKALKRLAQKWHCLVVTATQADAASYSQDRLNSTNFSEDKRKFSHVNAMYGLNQSSLEKRLGLMRVNEIIKREGEYFNDREVKLLQSLACGRPLLDSFW